ncbi:MAG: glycosyltransferase family 4 protein [Acidobacteriia bacterium]|nr:glycosyltransferase family 4 protein [Terriglobia bacterium]
MGELRWSGGLGLPVFYALMPAIHDRQTGGSIYNRQMLDHLAKSTPIELYLDGPGTDYSRWPGGLWLVDSLCLERGATHLAHCPGASGVLIAHYLEILDPRRQDSARAAAEAALLNRYRAVVTTSRFAQRALMAAGFEGAVVAIPPELAPEYRSPVQRRRAAEKAAIVTIASIVPAKGLMEMLDALIQLSDLDWTWEVIGDAALDAAFADRFRDRVGRSPVSRRISMRGALAAAAIMDVYDRSDLFALPSRFETCSMATMEAMARGLPVAAFQVGGLPDLLPEVSRQALIPPGDAAGWVQILRRLLSSADERRHLGEANRQASASFPSWGDSGRALESFLSRP